MLGRLDRIRLPTPCQPASPTATMPSKRIASLMTPHLEAEMLQIWERARERRRVLAAAKLIQRIWRGYKIRRELTNASALWDDSAMWGAWNTTLKGKESPQASSALEIGTSQWTSSTQNPIRVGNQSGGMQTRVDRLDAVVLESMTSGAESETPMVMALVEQDWTRRPSSGDAVQHAPTTRGELDSVNLPQLPTSLGVQGQDSVLTRVNDRLSQCAFDFVAKYQFPIPLSPRPAIPQDREWTEWVYILKWLAFKRRIPARVLYNGQIKQLVPILENSLGIRRAPESGCLRDDRHILQLISASIQVVKILRDGDAMIYLDRLYIVTEDQLQERKVSSR